MNWIRWFLEYTGSSYKSILLSYFCSGFSHIMIANYNPCLDFSLKLQVVPTCFVGGKKWRTSCDFPFSADTRSFHIQGRAVLSQITETDYYYPTTLYHYNHYTPFHAQIDFPVSVTPVSPSNSLDQAAKCELLGVPCFHHWIRLRKIPGKIIWCVLGHPKRPSQSPCWSRKPDSIPGSGPPFALIWPPQENYPRGIMSSRHGLARDGQLQPVHQPTGLK